MLTFLSRPRLVGQGEEKRFAYAFACFPLVGLIFGFVALVTLRWTYLQLPIFAAWTTVVLWLLLSRGIHLADFYRVVTVMLTPAAPEERVEALSKRLFSVPALVLTGMLVLGKLLAIVQASVLSFRSALFLVLLVPVFARYVGALLALSSSDEQEPAFAAVASRRLFIVLLMSIILVALSYLSMGLALVLIVCSMLTVGIARVVWMRSFRTIVVPHMGAVIELAELVMLWGCVVCAGYGLRVLQ